MVWELVTATSWHFLSDRWLVKGTLRWIPKDVSPNHKGPKWFIHRYLATPTKRVDPLHFLKGRQKFHPTGGLHLHHSKRFGYDAWKPKRHFLGGITLPNHLAWPIRGLVANYKVLPRWCITLKFNSEKTLKSHRAPKRKDRLSLPTVFTAICWFPCVQVYGIPKA